MQQTTKFLRSFLRSPGSVGAIAPSSQQLARIMTDWIEWDTVNWVAEYGPGTGVFTEHILRRKRPEARFFAIERDRSLAETVRDRFPGVEVFQDSVANVESICQQVGTKQLDAIICGLPWASFSETLQRECMEAMRHVLRPGGQFATFAYWQGLLLPAGQRFRRRLGEYFPSVETSETAWVNLPPAFVYRCRK